VFEKKDLTTNDKCRSDLELYNDVHVLIHVINESVLLHLNEQYEYDDIVNDGEFVDHERIVHKV
jgi:hypothetical protein